jgi:proprotein convertase subtilisin/kexin type 7
VRQWAVNLRDDDGHTLDNAAVDQIATLRNLKNAGPVGELEGFWLFEAAEDHQSDCVGGHCLRKRTSAEVDFELNEHADVRWIEEQKPQKRVTRTVPEFADPLFGDQWHLVRFSPAAQLQSSSNQLLVLQVNMGKFGEDLAGHDINVAPVWAAGINGTGVTVSVVDDGVDFLHPDIAPNWSAESSWDFTRKNNEPMPGSKEDTHGTRCAGQIAAVPNNICGVGVAFGAKVAGELLLRIF